MSNTFADQLTRLRTSAGAAVTPAPSDSAKSAAFDLSLNTSAAPATSNTKEKTRDERVAQQLARIRGPRNRARTNQQDETNTSRTNATATSMRWLEAINGHEVAPGLAKISRRYPYGTTHGNLAIHPPGKDVLHRFHETAFKPEQLVAIDTETTGLSGGTGTVAFLVGIARFTADALEVEQLLMTRFAGEAGMLSALGALIGADDVLLSYNGKSYDLPLLKTRCRLRRLKADFPALPHIDMVHAVRRTFKHHWANCRLSTAERELFGFHRHNDIAGADIPEVWVQWLRDGDAAELTRVVSHNQDDLVSLALLPGVLTKAQDAPHRSHAAWTSAAKDYVKSGHPEQALRYLASHANSLDPDGLHMYAQLARREGDQTTAIKVWKTLAAQGDCTAIEHLAKDYEHRCRDYPQALTLTNELLRLQPRPTHAHRQHRLKQKIAAS
jgi:uncharacterized protein YprB with RNaseH-like and TPR domain